MEVKQIKAILPELEKEKVEAAIINLLDYLIIAADVYEENLKRTFPVDINYVAE